MLTGWAVLFGNGTDCGFTACSDFAKIGLRVVADPFSGERYIGYGAQLTIDREIISKHFRFNLKIYNFYIGFLFNKKTGNILGKAYHLDET